MTAVKAKLVLSTLLIILLITISFLSFPDNKRLTMFFCDVGQGDSIYIRFPNGQDMLIDGGPGYKVLECLGHAMPFYDRHINVIVLTHPQQDHLFGLIPVVERYSIDYLVSSPAGNTSQTYMRFKDLVVSKQIEVKNLYTNSSIQFDEASFDIIWPEREWVYNRLKCSDSACNKLALSNNVLGVSSTSSDLNNYSIVGIIKYKTFEAVLTGDGDIKIQDDIERLGFEKAKYSDIEILKVPHHGSKTAMTDWFLTTFKPELAIITAGKDNRYGHPDKSIVDKLSGIGAQVMQTDIEGTIKVETDGEIWDAVSLYK